jgi:hypothetical protein
MSFTAAEIAARWARRAAMVNPEVRRTIRGLAELHLATSLKQMEAGIYSKPEDVSGTGRKKWVRTGRLRAGERVLFSEDGAGFTLTNVADYAEPRHEANKPGRRRINPARTSHWRDETREALRTRTAYALAAMNLRISRAGGGS